MTKLSIFIPILLLIGIASSPSGAQQLGPQGVSVTRCVSVSQLNGRYRFANTCDFVIEVTAAQPLNGQPRGGDDFQLFP